MKKGTEDIRSTSKRHRSGYSSAPESHRETNELRDKDSASGNQNMSQRVSRNTAGISTGSSTYRQRQQRTRQSNCIETDTTQRTKSRGLQTSEVQ